MLINIQKHIAKTNRKKEEDKHKNQQDKNIKTTKNNGTIPKPDNPVKNELLKANKNKEPNNNAKQPINKIFLRFIISAKCPEKKDVTIKGNASVRPIKPSINSSFVNS